MTEQEARNKIAEIRDEMKQAEIRWKSDPLHWTNNKRRLHGLCALRGVANKKNRFELPPLVRITYNQELFKITSEYLATNMDKIVQAHVDQMVSIKEVPYGVHRFSFAQ